MMVMMIQVYLLPTKAAITTTIYTYIYNNQPRRTANVHDVQ